MAIDSKDEPSEAPPASAAAELERLRNQDPLLDSMVRRAQVRSEFMQWSLRPHLPLTEGEPRVAPGRRFPRLENLTVLELKQFIASIPDYLDEVPIHYVDFGGWEEPRFYLDQRPEPEMVIRGAPADIEVSARKPRELTSSLASAVGPNENRRANRA